MGLLRGMARTAVVAGTATAVSNRVSRRQSQRWAADEAPAAEYAPPPQASMNNDDQMQQLERLGQLRDQGILTDQEFDMKKRQILGF